MTNYMDIEYDNLEEVENFDKSKKRKAGKIDEYIGNSMRCIRLVLGITQFELAKSIGITFQQLQKYENGTNRVSAATLASLSKVLKVPVSGFFPPQKKLKKNVLNENRASLTNNFSSNANKEVFQIVEMYNKIGSVKTKQKILLLLEELSKRY